MIHLDTHVLLWLHAGQVDRIPAAALELLDDNDLVASPMVRLELDYLHEIGRINVDGATIVEDLRRQIGLTISSAGLDEVVEQAAGQSWTRDPFDRMVVGNALADSCPLVTADRVILEHFHGARWG